MPALSVVICTRDRGICVLDTARSILAGGGADLDYLIVDQSSDASVENALTTMGADPRVRYVRTDTRGLSAGHATSACISCTARVWSA